MTLDLAKIKSDAEKIAANSDLLLMALPVKDVLGMLAEIEELRKDAGRYRFIRGYYTKVSVEIAIPGFESDWVTGDQADKQIDSAMAAERP